MLAYRYRARDSQGVAVRGRLQAITPAAALQELTRQGFFVSELQPEGGRWARDLERVKLFLTRRTKIKLYELAVFARQLGVLYAAGVPILAALGAIRQQQGERTVLGAALKRLESRLAQGDSLTQALRDDTAFPPILVSMVAAGEAGGVLEEVLAQAAAYFEREYQTGEKVKNALTYPKFVGAVALVITWFLLATVVPNFAGIFGTFDLELPPLTGFMLQLSDFLVTWNRLLLSLLLVFLLGWRRWRATVRGKSWLDRLRLRLPILGKLTNLNAISRFCRTLAALTHSGVNAVNALQLAEQTVDNAVYTVALQRVRIGIGHGNSLADELDRSQLFPPMLLQMVRVGESSGSLDSMLNRLADFYDQDLDNLTQRLAKMIEPILLLLVSLVVGLIVLAIALPMMQTVNIVQF